MSDDAREPIVARVQRLGLRPGEYALIQLERPLDRERIEYLREQIRLALPDNKAIVLGPGVTLRALTEEERRQLLDGGPA